MPFYNLTLSARKPRNKAYPQDINTLGDHIRLRRLGLGLHQKDVATIVNATTSTVTNWEKNRTTPAFRYIPKIITFLGYNPLDLKVGTFGEKIKLFRLINGVSQKKLAKRIGIDPDTLARWEEGKIGHRMKNKEKLNSMIRYLNGSIKPE